MMRLFFIFIVILTVSACNKTEDQVIEVVMKTDKGAITLALYPDKAPISTNNFLRYVDDGLYDGALFYRATRPGNDPMIEVIQGGLWEPFGEVSDLDFVSPLPPIAHETTQISGQT